MKFTLKPRIKAIEADSAEEFERQFNSFMDDYGCYGDYTIEISNGKFFAVIQYKEEIQTPETLAEEYELRGEVFYCRDCPECIDPMLGNQKRCDCKYAEYGFTRKDNHACEWFYKQLSQGKIKPL